MYVGQYWESNSKSLMNSHILLSLGSVFDLLTLGTRGRPARFLTIDALDLQYSSSMSAIKKFRDILKTYRQNCKGSTISMTGQ